jgi:hypothetical protein
MLKYIQSAPKLHQGNTYYQKSSDFKPTSDDMVSLNFAKVVVIGLALFLGPRCKPQTIVCQPTLPATILKSPNILAQCTSICTNLPDTLQAQVQEAQDGKAKIQY